MKSSFKLNSECTRLYILHAILSYRGYMLFLLVLLWFIHFSRLKLNSVTLLPNKRITRCAFCEFLGRGVEA